MQAERRMLFLLLSTVLAGICVYALMAVTRYQLLEASLPLAVYRLDRRTGELCLFGPGGASTGVRLLGQIGATERRFGRLACAK